MTEPWQGALLTAVYQKLDGASGIWGNRVRADFAEDTLAHPLVIFAISAGVERNQRPVDDPIASALVKCIAETRASALLGAAEITAILNDADDYVTAKRLTAADWHILTVSATEQIYLVEHIDGASKQLYHAGAIFDITMEAK